VSNEQKTTMIIAEQDDVLSNSLSLFFSENYKVICVREFEQIKQYLNISHILLIEANILEKAGLNVLQDLKKSFPQLFIVVMGTAKTKVDFTESFVKKYADALVYKPFDVGRISRIIFQLNRNNIASHSTL